MDELFNLLIVFILTLLTVIALGLVAGFSPTLYVAQATLSSKKATVKSYTMAIMGGVLAAVFVLLLLFQTFNLATIFNLINSTVQALLVSIVFNILVGILFVFGGVKYINQRDVNKAYSTDVKKVKNVTGIGALFAFGFAKTFISISGATAVFIGGNIIASATVSIVDRAIFTAIFLAATIVPFIGMLQLIQRNPERLRKIANYVKTKLARTNYRLVVGVAAVLFGSSIIIINIMMALFY